jgi:hypothetical protein
MKILALILMLVISLTASNSSGCNGCWCSTEGQSGTQNVPAEDRPYIDVISLNIDKTEVNVGQSVTISAVCKNSGTGSGSYEVKFFDWSLVDPTIRQEQINLGVGESKQIDHIYNTDATTRLGDHTVQCGSKYVTFKVIPLPTTPATGTTPDNPAVPSGISYPPLTLEPATLSDGVVSEAYTADVRPGGGKTPYTLSVPPGSLPAGLNIVPVADYFRIEGTPTTYRQYEFEITVDDDTASTTAVKATFKLTIFPNLKGTWTYSIAVTHAEGVCQGEEGPAHSRVITITQNGRKVTFSGFTGNPGNRLIGEILPPKSSSIDNKEWVNKTEQWVVYVAGDYWEDGGTTSSMHRLVINTASDMSGDESWTWTGGGGTCPNGKGSINATRISGP